MPVFNSSYKDKPTFLFVSLTLSTVDKPGTLRNPPSSWASENPIIKVEYFPGPVKESLLGCTLCCLTVQNLMALAHHKRDVQPIRYCPWVDNPTLLSLCWSAVLPQNSFCQGPGSTRSSISPAHSATADVLKARPVLSGALLSLISAVLMNLCDYCLSLKQCLLSVQCNNSPPVPSFSSHRHFGVGCCFVLQNYTQRLR